MVPWLDRAMGSAQAVGGAHESLLALAEEVSHSGSWAWRSDTGELALSTNLQRMWQVDSEPMQPLQTVLERAHPGDRARLGAWLDQIRAHQSPERLTFRIQLPDGEVRFMDARTGRRTDDAGREFFVGWIQDVTETHRAEIEIACHLAVSAALGDWEDTDTGISGLIEALAGALRLQRGTLWVPGPEGMAPRWEWHEPGHELTIVGPMLDAGRRYCDLAWTRREPVWVGSIDDDANYPFDDESVRRRFTRGLIIPCMSGGEPLAVIAFSGSEGMELTLTDRLRATLAGIGTEIGASLATLTGILQPPVLTRREIEVLRLASQGLSGPAIAGRLSLSPATVKTHFEHIYVKYEVPDRVSAVARALREGLID